MEEKKKPIVALLYDFDKTLCTQDMQNYAFIPGLGMTPAEFWAEANGFGRRNRIDGILAYMYIMLREAERKKLPFTREDLVEKEDAINKILMENGVSINQQQFDALASLTYTLGRQWMSEDARLYNYLIDGIDRYTDAEIVNAIATWCHVDSEPMEALVRRRRRYGTGIHQRHGGNLSALQLGAFPVREIPGGMADGQCIVGRRVACSEAGPAERRLNDRSRADQIRHRAVFHKLHVDRRAGRIYAECKSPGTDILSPDDVRRRADIFKSAARTSGDDPLLYI